MNPPGSAGYFARRWRGEVAAASLFWRDMLVVGTGLNLLFTFAALMLAAQGVSGGLAAAVHFAPLPYNLFLVLSLWRLPGRAPALCWLAAIWLALVTVI